MRELNKSPRGLHGVLHGVLRGMRALALALAASLTLFVPAQAQAQEGGKIISAHGISTFGDLKYPAGFPHLDYVNPDAPKGGEISLWTQGTFDTFNPYSRKGRAGALSSIFYESLLEGTADEIGTSYGLLADHLEYPEDKSWVIFTLRPEARFADGSALTAEDVLFSYELFRDQGLPSFSAVLKQQVAGAEVLDPLRIRFTFAEEAPKRDVIDMVGGLPVMSKAWFEATGARLDESRMEPALGSGPYVLDSYDVNERITYRRNPDYWGADLPLNRGRHNFDRIRIEYFADSNAAFEAFKSGIYTFRVENFSKAWATQYDFKALNEGSVIKEALPDGSLSTGQSFVFNLRRAQFQDKRVREAIGLMFNFEWSNQTLFYGLYARIHSFWENSYLAAEGLPSAEELALLEPLADLLPEGVLTEPAVMAPGSGKRQFDRKALRRAAALLDEAGWIVGDDGMRRNAQGDLLKVEFLETSAAFERIVNPFVENLRRLGVDARLERVDPSQYTDRQRNFDYDIITDHFSLGYEPSTNLKQYLGSASAGTSLFNTAGVADPAVDALIEKVMRAETRDELITAVKALDRVLRAMKIWVPQWFKDEHWVAYFDMYDHPEPLPPYALGQLDFWWFNQDKYEALKAAGVLR